MIARLSVSAPSRADCERLLQGVRWYFWLVWSVQAATLSCKKLRTLLFGCGSKLPTPPAPETSAAFSPSPWDGEATGAVSSRNEEVGPSAETGAQLGAVASVIEPLPKAQGGQRPGTGHLGTAA
jgi:hypothetical protein